MQYVDNMACIAKTTASSTNIWCWVLKIKCNVTCMKFKQTFHKCDMVFQL